MTCKLSKFKNINFYVLKYQIEAINIEKRIVFALFKIGSKEINILVRLYYDYRST